MQLRILPLRVFRPRGLSILLASLLCSINAYAQNPQFNETDRQKLLGYTLTEETVRKWTALSQKLRAAIAADPSLEQELDSAPPPGPNPRLDELSKQLTRLAPRLARMIEDGGFTVAEYELCQLVIMFACVDAVRPMSGFAQPRSGYTSAANIQFADDHTDLIVAALKDQPHTYSSQSRSP